MKLYKCSRCHKYKPQKDFHKKARSVHRNGLSEYCKDCVNVKRKRSYRSKQERLVRSPSDDFLFRGGENILAVKDQGSNGIVVCITNPNNTDEPLGVPVNAQGTERLIDWLKAAVCQQTR